MGNQEETGEINELDQIALSPDGQFIAFVGYRFDKEWGQVRNALFLLSLDQQGHAVKTEIIVPAQVERISGPVWSPDSQRLLFLAEQSESYMQVWLTDRTGMVAQRLTEMERGVQELSWSPDGHWLAFTALARSESKEVEGQQGEQYYTQLFLQPAPGSVFENLERFPRRLTSEEVDYIQPAWTADSQEIGVLCNYAEDHERSFLNDLWAIGPLTGKKRCLTRGTLEIESYSWSPDGKSAILIAGEHGKEAGGSTYLYLVTRRGNVGDNILQLAPDLDSVTLPQTLMHPGIPGIYRPVWSKDGQKIYFLLTEQQAVNIYELEIVWRTVTKITEQGLSSFLALSSAGLIVAQQYPEESWELYYIPLEGGAKGRERLTDHTVIASLLSH